MPTFECTSDSSDPVVYVHPGPSGTTVEGRVFAKGEHVAAAENPDPDRFTEIHPEP